jgi:hypothetical protein
MVREFLFLFRQEVCSCCRLWEDEKSCDAHSKCQATFHEEEILPAMNTTLDLEDTERYQTSKCASDLGCRVVDTQATGELPTSVEGRQIEYNTGI